MAGNYPYIIFALILIIYSRSTDAESKCNFRLEIIKGHLREEREYQEKFHGNRRDRVQDLSDEAKEVLCDEVARHLNGDVLASLLREDDLPEPRVVDTHTQLTCRTMPIKDLYMSKPMYWCEPKMFTVTAPQPYATTIWIGDKSIISEVDGFFCAGSSTHNDRVYVFRSEDKNAREVTPIAELNEWTPQKDS